jgi:hypothetical protein
VLDGTERNEDAAAAASGIGGGFASPPGGGDAASARSSEGSGASAGAADASRAASNGHKSDGAAGSGLTIDARAAMTAIENSGFVCPAYCPPAPVYSSIEEFFWSRHTHQTVRQVLRRFRLDWEMLEFLLPGVAFVALYSVLPHKELRFLLPGMPLLHIAAARGASKLYRFGEALLYGMQRVKPGPEAAAAELVGDALETSVTERAPPAVAAAVSTPRARLRQRHQRYEIENQRSVGRAAGYTQSLGRTFSPSGAAGSARRPAIPAFDRIKREISAESAGASAASGADAGGGGSAAVDSSSGGEGRSTSVNLRAGLGAAAPLPRQQQRLPSRLGKRSSAAMGEEDAAALEGPAEARPLSGDAVASTSDNGAHFTFPSSTVSPVEPASSANGETDAEAEVDADAAAAEAEAERATAEWQQHAGRVSLLRRALGFLFVSFVALVLAGSTAATFLFVRVSMHNYPGGEALQRLYTLYAADINGRIVLQQQKAAIGPAAPARGRAGTAANAAATSAAGSALPQLPEGRLPPCPLGDITATGPLEWWRQCIDAKAGCPPSIPWALAVTAGSDAAATTPPAPATVGVEGMWLRLKDAVTLGWWLQPTPPVTSFAPSAPKHALVCGTPGAPGVHTMSVHIDVAAAETGVSRFGEAWSVLRGWRYDKSENLTRPLDFARFDYLLTENATRHADLFEVLETIHTYVRVDWRSLRIVRKPFLFIMRRRREDLATRRRLMQQQAAADAAAAAAKAEAAARARRGGGAAGGSASRREAGRASGAGGPPHEHG